VERWVKYLTQKIEAQVVNSSGGGNGYAGEAIPAGRIGGKGKGTCGGEEASQRMRVKRRGHNADS